MHATCDQAHIVTFLVLLQALAATAPNSQERFEARRVLPGMASRLRQVCFYLLLSMQSTMHVCIVRSMRVSVCCLSVFITQE